MSKGTDCRRGHRCDGARSHRDGLPRSRRCRLGDGHGVSSALHDLARLLDVRRVQLTPALDQLRQESGLQGFCVQGDRYDIGGEPHTYVATLNALAKKAPSSGDTPSGSASGSPMPKRPKK